MKLYKHIIAAAVLTTMAGSALALGNADNKGLHAQQRLMQTFPGVHKWNDGQRDRIFYGQLMTTAKTPQAAAQQWLKQYGASFGAGVLDLVSTWEGDIRDGKFYAIHYTQQVGGLDVEGSVGRVLVRNNLDGTWSVVYAAGLFASLPKGGFAPLTHTAQDALNFVQGSNFGHLPQWSTPELVAYQLVDANGATAVRAWKFVGENPDLANREKYTFFVDANTGALLEARNEVLNIDVFGFVRGFGSPGNLPDEASNPPVLLPINDAQVSISGGNSAFADASGFFNITHSGSSDVTITSNFDTGHWVNINNQASGGVLSASATATPGSEANLEYNSTPSEYETSQVNAFIYTGRIHNLFTDRSSWTGMNFRATVNVNINSSCNAFFDGSSTNFFRKAGGCNNTAYSTVVTHEYGHYVVNRLGLSQGAFGEGYGDTCSELVSDTGIVGEDFFTNGGFIRDNDNVIRTYPCSGEVHFCGQLLAGVWWHMRENFGATYGSADGLEQVTQLMVDWSLITTGGQGDNSAHPGTAIEVLTLDDDDGNLGNGTPNYDDICAAFELHNVPCPDIVPLVFVYPDGLPTLVSPSGGTTMHVQILGNAGFTPDPGTGVFHLDTGSGFSDIPMNEIADNFYEVVFPAIECQTDVAYYFSGLATDGTMGQDPQDAPADFYAAYSAESRSLFLDDDFQDDKGWTTVNESTGANWNRSAPIGNNGGNPTSDFDGSGKAYITGFLTFQDVDGGTVRLLSPVFDMSGAVDPTISYARWFHNSNPQDNDSLVIEVSNDFGANWTVMEDLGHQGNQWIQVIQHVTDYVPVTSGVQFRFSASDIGDDSLTEAGVDAVLIEEVDCGNVCVADFNGDGNVNTQDVTAFLNAWNAQDASADINMDGNVNTQDVTAFLNLWNIGCG